MTRAQWTLAGLLAVQLLLLVGFRSPISRGADDPGSRPLIPVLESITPAKLQLEAAGGASVSLQRTEDGWALDAAEGYPADASKVDDLVDELEALRVRRPVVSSTRYHDALKVTESDFERRLRVWDDPSNDPAVDLLLGTSPNYRVSHVRLTDDDRVYEIIGLGPADLRADGASWIERKIVDVAFDDVVRVSLENEEGRFSLERGHEGWNVVEPSRSSGEGLNQTQVDSLVRSLCSLWLTKPIGKKDDEAHGFSSPAARYELTHRPGGIGDAADEAPATSTVDDQMTVVLVGAEVEGESNQRYVTRDGFGFTATASQGSLTNALEKALADLRS
ncbi:MAG: DUF4340 domain-containing protein [Acidobacteriota bacterium]|nr:MAG: DUF4340 domain-containing protein [Acidobacteriota bacterium]